MGFKILMAVRKPKLALYINPLSPVKLTFLTPIFTSWAPSCVSSFASNSSKPNKVLATILKLFSIADIK